MAWRNIALNLNIGYGNIVQSDVTNWDFMSLTSWNNVVIENYINYSANARNTFIAGTLFGTSPNYVELTRNGNFCGGLIHLDHSINYASEFSLDNDNQTWTYIACVDDDTQKGFFAFVKASDNTYRYLQFFAGANPPLPNSTQSGYNVRSLMYVLLTGNELHLYNWVSVPSVSGKNGILSLSTSTDTNNGEAITTSDTTKFALTAESNINKLIVDRMNQGD